MPKTVAVPCIAHFVEGTSNAAFKMTDPAGRLYVPDRYFVGLQAQVTVVRGLSAQSAEAPNQRDGAPAAHRLSESSGNPE